MKKILLSLMVISSAAIYASAEQPTASTPQQAVQQANQACQAFGYQQAQPSTQSQSHGSVTYNNGRENNGTKNTYNGNAGISGGANAGVVSGSANAGAGVTREGSQTNTNSSTSGTIYYQCK